VPSDQFQTRFGFLAGFIGMDNPVSTSATRKLLGWEPVHPSLLADLDEGHYFSRPAASH
jgi:hypothetical protein